MYTTFRLQHFYFISFTLLMPIAQVCKNKINKNIAGLLRQSN